MLFFSLAGAHLQLSALPSLGLPGIVFEIIGPILAKYALARPGDADQNV